MRKKASYKGIPCWYDTVTDELIGRNMFYDFLLEIALCYSGRGNRHLERGG